MTWGDLKELTYLMHWVRRVKAQEEHRVRAAASCQGKDSFQSFAQADGTIGHRLRQFSHAYRCTVCGRWHIGGRRIDRHRRLELQGKRRASE